MGPISGRSAERMPTRNFPCFSCSCPPAGRGGRGRGPGSTTRIARRGGGEMIIWDSAGAGGRRLHICMPKVHLLHPNNHECASTARRGLRGRLFPGVPDLPARAPGKPTSPEGGASGSARTSPRRFPAPSRSLAAPARPGTVWSRAARCLGSGGAARRPAPAIKLPPGGAAPVWSGQPASHPSAASAALLPPSRGRSETNAPRAPLATGVPWRCCRGGRPATANWPLSACECRSAGRRGEYFKPARRGPYI